MKLYPGIWVDASGIKILVTQNHPYLSWEVLNGPRTGEKATKWSGESIGKWVLYKPYSIRKYVECAGGIIQ